jgi:hypothetical protein
VQGLNPWGALQELEHTSATLAALETSSATLKDANDEYGSQRARIKQSHKLLTKMHRSSILDRVAMWAGIILFSLVVLYIVLKRAVYFVPPILVPTLPRVGLPSLGFNRQQVQPPVDMGPSSIRDDRGEGGTVAAPSWKEWAPKKWEDRQYTRGQAESSLETLEPLQAPDDSDGDGPDDSVAQDWPDLGAPGHAAPPVRDGDAPATAAAQEAGFGEAHPQYAGGFNAMSAAGMVAGPGRNGSTAGTANVIGTAPPSAGEGLPTMQAGNAHGNDASSSAEDSRINILEEVNGTIPVTKDDQQTDAIATDVGEQPEEGTEADTSTVEPDDGEDLEHEQTRSDQGILAAANARQDGMADRLAEPQLADAPSLTVEPAVQAEVADDDGIASQQAIDNLTREAVEEFPPKVQADADAEAGTLIETGQFRDNYARESVPRKEEEILADGSGTETSAAEPTDSASMGLETLKSTPLAEIGASADNEEMNEDLPPVREDDEDLRAAQKQELLGHGRLDGLDVDRQTPYGDKVRVSEAVDAGKVLADDDFPAVHAGEAELEALEASNDKAAKQKHLAGEEELLEGTIDGPIDDASATSHEVEGDSAEIAAPSLRDEL